MKKKSLVKVITDLPDNIDPVVFIEKKMRTCPFCNKKESTFVKSRKYSRRDKEGKHHIFLLHKNKYIWAYYSMSCGICQAKWDAGWFPIDRKMFTVEIDCKGDLFK